MYRHRLIEANGQAHDLLLGSSFFGDDAPALAQLALQDGQRYTQVNRRPYLDGRPFTGTIERHWGAIYHFREGLLNDPEPMVPAVYEPGPRGQMCFYKDGQRDDPAEGVPALIPQSGPPVFYRRGVPRPGGQVAMDERALAMVRGAAEVARASRSSARQLQEPMAVQQGPRQVHDLRMRA